MWKFLLGMADQFCDFCGVKNGHADWCPWRPRFARNCD